MLNQALNDLAIVAVLNLCIGLWVLIKNPNNIVNQSFFVFILGITSWICGVILLYQTHNFSYDNLALGGGLVTFLGISLFTRVFPTKEKFSLGLEFFAPIIAGFLILPFHLFISGIIIDKNNLIKPINGTLFLLYVILGLLYFVAIPGYFFAQNYSNETPKAKLQMKYLGLGVFIFILCSLSFNVLLPLLGIYKYNILGPASSIVLVLMTGYAIARHQLLDIRIVIQRSAIYSLLFTLIITTYISLLYLGKIIFDQYQQTTTPIFAGIVMLISIITIPKIESYFQKITNRIFFREAYDYPNTLEELSSILNITTDFTEMVSISIEKLNTIFRPNFIEFSYSETGNIFTIYDHESAKKNEQVIPSTRLEIPIKTRKRTVGVFILGTKRSGDLYTKSDLKLLRTFAGQAAVAFEKAELYHKLQKYSRSLEQKVYARTRKLTELQENQRQLFDDISHALQTPLTVLKSAVELIKTETGNYDKRSLETMEYSIENLSRLIREILELATLDSLPLSISLLPINLSIIAKSVTEYVEVICQQLTYGL